MKIIVNSMLSFIVLLCSCTSRDCINGIYLSEGNDQLLLIDSANWKILHSRVATFCDRFEAVGVNQNDKKLIALDSIRSKYYEGDTVYFFRENDIITIEETIFYKVDKIEWDSIVISLVRNDSVIESHMIEPKKSRNLELELLASTISIQEFQYTDPSFVESNQHLLLKLFDSNKCIATKSGANNFICIHY